MIDLEAARRHGVAIRWTPGVNRQAVAELTIGFMIALCRSIVPLALNVREGVWRQPGGGRQLSSAVIGVLGCGHVGQQVARLGRAFGATVLAHDVRAYDEFYREYGVQPVAFSALLEQSDIVTVHVPLDASTRGLIGAHELSSMKRAAYLVNTARGGIVDESAVAAALVERRLAGAAFDVFTAEPPVNRELLRAPNFIGTPALSLLGEDIPVDVLYEDDDVLVVNKPAGLVVHPAHGHASGTLVNAVVGKITADTGRDAADP